MKNRFFIWIAMWCFATTVLLAQSSSVYRVKPGGTGDGSSWDNAMSLEKALEVAKSGDKIYAKGSENGLVYVVPEGGFILKSGVELYGGFKGEANETPDDRPTLDAYNRFSYASVLNGDVNGNDLITEEELHTSATRTDNRAHVVVMDLDPALSGNLNKQSTVLNGFSIAGGQAKDFGGGVFVKGSEANGAGAYRIERCFLYNNYAPLGGAVYVDEKVKSAGNMDDSFINHCVLFNNMAGQLGEASNSGAGAYLAGCGYIANTSVYNNVNGGVRLSAEAYLLNATVTRNTVAGVDMIDAKDAEGTFHVTNSIVWGNTTFSSDFRPGTRYSAFNEALGNEAQYGNVYVGSKNNDKGTPSLHFEAPSPTARYDVSFNATTDHYPEWSWNLMEGSVAIDKANIDFYNKAIFGEFDLDKTRRISGIAIDMGAFEYQYLLEGRIRYVKEGGTGDGSSWENAMGNLQLAIDELAKDGGGEVWVAAGTYVPISHIDGDTSNPVSFVMRDNVSVYGGFDRDNPETSKSVRQVGDAPWTFKNETVLKGSFTGNPELKWLETESKWNLTSGSSAHVVWFAPLPGKGTGAMGGFQHITVLDGVTITGGKASFEEGASTYADSYMKSHGAGVYMVDNAYLQNCIVKGNVAEGNGGGIYMQGGRVVSSLVFNNGAEGNGGGIYVNGFGLVLRSMLTNNSAEDGAACYFNAADSQYANYLILSTSVVGNNTARKNAAVYCNNGGVVMQTTLANNHTVGNTDESKPDITTRTGGLYVKGYGSVINSLIWKNSKVASGTDVEYVPIYVNGASMEKTQFLNCGVSPEASWEGSWQQNIVWLADTDKQEGVTPLFNLGYPEKSGVQPDLNEVNYYWQIQNGSNLRAKGLALGAFPENILFEPEIDIFGTAFPQVAGLGAFNIGSQPITPEKTERYMRVYVESNNADFSNNGNSWNKPYASLSEAIAYLASLSAEEVGDRDLEIHVKEGTVVPKSASLDIDPRSCRIPVPAMKSGKKLYIKGGFSRENPENNWHPDNYRTVIEGNSGKTALNQGLYHCIVVEDGAKVEFDGFHVNGGYAVSKAMMTYGAGLLAADGAEVTLRNCIFENHSAQDGVAVDAREATLTAINCVFSNNEAHSPEGAIVNAKNLTMQHCTMVNNIGKAVKAVTGGTQTVQNSFEMGGGNSTVAGMVYYSDAVDATMFLNPTTSAGPQLNYATAVGGYPLFKPTNLNPCVNKVTEPIAGLTTDLTGGGRSLGGAPDFGAYEAPLPADGQVLYVRANGNDNNDGSSWNTPLRTITAALGKAKTGMEIWVSGGTYEENVTMKEGVNVLGGFSNQGSPSNTLDGINRDLSHTKDEFRTVIKNTKDLPTEITEKSTDYTGEDLTARVLTQPRDFTRPTMWEGFVLTGGKSFLCNYGAGAMLRLNGHIKNCRIEENIYYESKYKLIFQYKENWQLLWRNGKELHNNDHTSVAGGGGLCCLGGKVENCQIVNNQIQGMEWNLKLPEWTENGRSYRFNKDDLTKVYAKGAGLSISGGDIINCVIARNVVGWHKKFKDDGITTGLTNILGAAVFVATKSRFVNCTIVENGGGWSDRSNAIVPGVWDIDLSNGKGSEFYNCIIAGNCGYGDTRENLLQVGKGLDYNPKDFIYSFTSVVNVGEEKNINDGAFTNPGFKYHEVKLSSWTKESDLNMFVEEYNAYKLLDANYNLNPKVSGLQNPCWNTGNSGYAADIYLDANGQNRVQDCVVDMGAYELSSEGNVKAGADNVLYVTADGAGLRNGSSPDNAACAEKLQEVLDYAGTLVKTAAKQPVVKIAGYRDSVNIYRPVVLLTEAQPQLKSTFTVPYGVKVMGGYNEETSNWNDDNRAVNEYTTQLSAKTRLVGNSQEVSGFHVLTFETKPEDWTKDFGTVVDGVYIRDGKATAAGSEVNLRGGGAIITDGIHLRNCVVLNNSAVNEGGGLYLMPGSLVSGCVIKDNESGQGGGLYASNTNADASKRVHLYACTINGNTAAYTGGGTYFESGAAFIMNSVVFGNKASSGKNVGGQDLRIQFADDMTKEAYGGTGGGVVTDDTKFYIFNGSAVEGCTLPGHLLNLNIGSDWKDYFNSETTWDLRAYSHLINTGIMKEIHQFMVGNYQVSAVDLAGKSRTDGSDKIDIGAYSFEGGYIDTKQHVERIFVALAPADEKLDAGMYANDLGRSFYTPLTSLDVALEYIYRMRDSQWGKETFFEIWMAKGMYKPTRQRPDAATELSGRQNSFVIPANVRIYGGFAGDELIADAGVSQQLIAEKKLIALTGETSDVMQKYLNNRVTADLNSNGLIEPWELANQTILSGNINADDANGKSYHVLFSDTKKYPPLETAAKRQVLLDGIVVMDGQTADRLDVATNDEVGRGGGLYTNGVDYICHRIRFLNNEGVRGGAIYGRSANVSVIGCSFEGNQSIATSDASNPSAGGAVYLSRMSNEPGGTFRAVNSLFANNETAGYGGAIAENNMALDLMSNTIVANKAALGQSAIYSAGGEFNKIANTVFWGNQGPNGSEGLKAVSGGDGAVSGGLTVTFTHSAIDGGSATFAGKGNVLLGNENLAVDGPRFVNPTEQAGVGATGLWNPAAISLLTEAGDSRILANETELGSDQPYYGWFDLASDALFAHFRNLEYGGQKRFAGPEPYAGEEPKDKVIDIGMYEYQYPQNMNTLREIYVALTASGLENGNGWENATSDLQGAIRAATHPNLSATDDDGTRIIYVKGADFVALGSGAGASFELNNTGVDNKLKNLTIYGSCTGNGAEQDFSKPTVIRVNAGNQAATLFDLNCSKPVTLVGLEMDGSNLSNAATVLSYGGAGDLTLKNVALRGAGKGLNAGSVTGQLKAVNTLFADNKVIGLETGNPASTTLVNNTFVKAGTDMSAGIINVYNTVSAWCSTLNLPEVQNNVKVAVGVANDNLDEGPNFVDPDNGDYRVRPSMLLTNRGDDSFYMTNAGVSDADKAAERDLVNATRFKGTIDVGAYEFASDLSQVICVKQGVVSDKADGSSWEHPMSDLQGAVDLASIYAKNYQKDAYVLVHQNVNATTLSVTYPNVRLYGSLSDRDGVKVGADGSVNFQWTEGLLEVGNRSEIATLNISNKSVADGFELTGPARLTNGGMLSTSLVRGAVNGDNTGILYNSLVENQPVTDVRAAWVTAAGTATLPADAIASRMDAAENPYVKDELWNYQLAETATNDLEQGERTAIEEYIQRAGHEVDLAGNKRVRGRVDNGCFEAWNVTEDAVVTADDYPRGKSVVYVRAGKLLKLEKEYKESQPFNPSFLLLEHEAGLMGMGNYVQLTNFAQERNLQGRECEDLMAVPFVFTDVLLDGGAVEEQQQLLAYLYDGAARAAYDYKFEKAGKDAAGKPNGAWKPVESGILKPAIGLYLVGRFTDDQVHKLRLMGNSYQEGGNKPKTIELMKFNYNDPWNSSTTGGNKFTHKENMSWNFVGSPFLCPMNLNDMDNRHVVYVQSGGGYATKGLDDMYQLPAGAGMLTQTATLREKEMLTIQTPGTVQPAPAPRRLAVALTAADSEDGAADELALTPVEAHEAVSDFRVNHDGVKWMGADSIPQLYALGDGGRYSLLSAVDKEGFVPVGICVPYAGRYTMHLHSDCEWDDCEAVVLIDEKLQRTVDLTEGAYSFDAPASGEENGRFRISFLRSAMTDDGSGVRVYSTQRGTITVDGLQSGYQVRVFTPSGMLVRQLTARQWQETFDCPAENVCLVRIDDAEGRNICVRKVRL